MSRSGSDGAAGPSRAVVLGAGGHGRVLVDLLHRLGEPVPAAVLDPDEDLHGTKVLDVPVRGADELLSEFAPADYVLVNGVGSVRSTRPRRDLYLHHRDRGYRFATLVHPNGDVARDTVLGQGVQVLSGAVVNPGAEVGENAIVNTGAVVEHDCTLGAHVHAATGAVAAGGVRLGEGVHLGAGATVIQGVEVGERTVIGAGAVVIRDLPPGVVAVGVPARIVDEIEERAGKNRP